MGKMMACNSRGRGFDSRSFHCLVNDVGQVVYTYMPLSLTSIIWYQSVQSYSSYLLWLGR